MDKRCPRGLRCLPSSPCDKGLGAIKDLRATGEISPGNCQWFVNDAQSQWCFFKYMADNNNTETPDHRIATLLLEDDHQIKKIIQNFKRRASTRDQLGD